MNSVMGSYVLMLMCVAAFVAAAPDGDAAIIVPESEVAPLYDQETSLYDELMQESEMVQVEAKVSAKAENGDQAESMVEAIVDLKAYCVAAKKMMENSDWLKGTGHIQNGVFMFIKAFGDETGKELVTEYAEVIGDLKAAHPLHAGIEGYLIEQLNSNVLHLKKITQMGTDGDGMTGKMFLRYKKFGLRQEPKYFEKLAVSITDYTTAYSALHEGKSGEAIAAWKKAGGRNIPEEMYAKVYAKYSAMQQAHDLLEEAGAKVAIRASYENADVKTGNDPIGALPVAGAKGGAKVREMQKFQMPSEEEMKKEAMEMAKAYMQKMADKGDSPEAVVKLIEAKLQGVNIRVTTGGKMFGESNQVPSVKIVGEYGTIEGKLDFVPIGGHTSTNNFILQPSGKPIGKVKHVSLMNDADVSNPWLCTKFEVQVGHGNPWINFLPNGKKSFVDGFWLDGSDGKLGPYYRLARGAKWLMLPYSANLVYKKTVAGKIPLCATLPVKSGDNACFDGTALDFQKKCDAYPKCQGYSYTMDKKEGGNGCLKYRCFSKDVNEDEEFEKEGKMDYWSRQAYEWTTTPVTDQCVTTCGQAPVTLYGTRFCKQISDSSKVGDEICDGWTPTMPKPKIPEKQCPGTPPCVTWKTSSAAQEGRHCATHCDFKGNTIYGNVWCQEVKSGDRVHDDKCQYWKLPKPAKQSTFCPPTNACVTWHKESPHQVTKCTRSVHLFQHGDFGGWNAAFPKGRFDYHQFTSRGARNDDASSIQVPSGCKAVLYQHGWFTGWTATFPSGSYPFHAFISHGARNDDASSIVVEDAVSGCPNQCGVAAQNMFGRVWCQENKSGREVSDSACDFWNLPKPSLPASQCPAAELCAQFKTEGVKETCPTACGNVAVTLYGRVYCENTAGVAVSDAVCTTQGHSKPGTPSKHCPATPICTPAPTPHPTPVPTPAPTAHACDAGRDTCDKHGGGICVKGQGTDYTCACKFGYKCTSGCSHDHRGHTCTKTPSPTPVPTPDPTPLPTPDPTPVPTPQPTPDPTPYPTPPPPPPPTPYPTPLSCNGKHVTLYQHGSFNGWQAHFGVGHYNYDAFIRHGARNDDASSISVPHGCKAYVYQHGDFHGWVAVFGGGDYNYNAFVNHGAQNDAASSIAVVNHDAPPPFQLAHGQCCWYLADNKPGHCPNCPGGNHHEWPHVCGTSRACD